MKKIILLVALVSLFTGCSIIEKREDGKSDEIVVSKSKDKEDKTPIIKKQEDNLFTLETADGKLITDKKYSFLSNPKDGVLFFKINEKDKYGLMNDQGNVIIEPLFDFVYGYNSGIAIIKKDNYFGIIDNKGKFVKEPQYLKVKHLEGKRYQLTYEDLTTEEIDLSEH